MYELVRANPSNAFVIRPYLDSDDIADDPAQRATRYSIDFGMFALEQAQRYPEVLNVVRQRAVADGVDLKDRWWQFLRPRPAIRQSWAM